MDIKSTDKNTFDAVYKANVKKVYRIALYYSGDHHAAEDITQTVFLKLCLNMENVNQERIEPWLKTTAKHMALNYKRHSKFEVDYPTEDVENLFETIAYEESVDELLEIRNKREVQTKLIEKIFADLYQKNPRWYEAVTITYILEKPQEEVAETMGLSLGALRIMLHRAKKWIRKHYQKQLDHLDET